MRGQVTTLHFSLVVRPRQRFRSFSYLPFTLHSPMAEECREHFRRFFHRDLREHRMEFISMLNYLIENFPFGQFTSLFSPRRVSSFRFGLSLQTARDKYRDDLRLTSLRSLCSSRSSVADDGRRNLAGCSVRSSSLLSEDCSSPFSDRSMFLNNAFNCFSNCSIT